MREEKSIECSRIIYHIVYDENLTFKDLEDLLKLIRISNNDVFQEIGVSRTVGNDLQRIESISPGSINLIAILKEILSIGVDCLAEKFVDKIYDRIQRAFEACRRNPKIDKPIYCKCNVNISIGCQEISIESNRPITNITIRVNNGNNTDI